MSNKEREERARYLYLNDPYFHKVVEVLIDILKNTSLDPNTLHDAVNLAADKSKPSKQYLGMMR